MSKKGDIGRVWDYVVNTQVWRSIMRHGYPDTPRNRSLAIMANVFFHLHPIRLRKSGLRVRYTWCMGGLTFFLFLVETITGLLLMFYYRPTAEYAYHDIVYLRADVALGTMRDIHRWGAHAMVITIWLHMMRVFLTGAYKPPREFNWGVGVVLLVLTLLLSFTGYLLPWDQLALWAVTVGTNMMGYTPVFGEEVRFVLLGGAEIGPETLLRWYVLHVLMLPFVIVIFMAIHFWRVRKDGGLSGPL
jgi:quinol-cytochrome oxidoreductase complex cytochrome b subunit